MTAQAAHFDRRDVIQAFAQAARQGAGRKEIEASADAFLASGRVVALAEPGQLRRGEVIRLHDGRTVSAIGQAPRYSTPAMLAAERGVIEMALERRDARAAVTSAESVARALAARPSMGPDQAAMVRGLCCGGDGVAVVVGKAGTGKTFALDAAREAWEACGMRVLGAAVARAAARNLSDSAGIEATSVAALLADLRRGGGYELARDSVLVVDEAGMLGTHDLAELLGYAHGAGTKVVLVGDHRQLPEIPAGGAFRGLAVRLGAIELTENRRQRSAHDREKVDHLRAGRVHEALEIADEHGDLILARTSEATYDRLVADYCAAREAPGEDCMMIALRRSEVVELSARARARLDATGRLGRERLALAGGEFAIGDDVVVKRNDRRLGVHNSDRGQVVDVDPAGGALTLELRDGRRVELAREFLAERTRTGDPSLAHGYAATAYVAQGMTTGRAFVLGSDAGYREWAYTAFTRARGQTRFYVCEPDIDSEHAHEPAGAERTALEAIETALECSQAQLMAHDLAERDQVSALRDRHSTSRGLMLCSIRGGTGGR